jgi:hypothetical protein
LIATPAAATSDWSHVWRDKHDMPNVLGGGFGSRVFDIRSQRDLDQNCQDGKRQVQHRRHRELGQRCEPPSR